MAAADDMAAVFGKGKPEPEAAEEEPMEEDGQDPAYTAAYEEYEASPSKETFWRAVKACMEAY